MMEADYLSDYISILDYGKIIARGTPRALKDRFIEEDTIRVEIKIDQPINGYLDEIKKIPSVIESVQHIPSHTGEFPTLSMILNNDDGIIDALTLLRLKKVNVLGLETKQPSLEDVFLSLTGRRLDQDTSVKSEE